MQVRIHLSTRQMFEKEFDTFEEALDAIDKLFSNPIMDGQVKEIEFIE